MTNKLKLPDLPLLPVRDDGEKEYTVSWCTDVYAPSHALAALAVAKDYFQERIAQGHVDTGCVFEVDDNEGEVIVVDLAKAVVEATPSMLQEVFGFEHPVQEREDWRAEVSGGNTLLGYWEWVKHKLTL